MEREAQDWLESDEVKRNVEEQGGGTLISNEPDLVGATVGQVYLLVRGIPGYTPELPGGLAMVANAVAIKLGALRYHARRYVDLLSALASLETTTLLRG